MCVTMDSLLIPPTAPEVSGGAWPVVMRSCCLPPLTSMVVPSPLVPENCVVSNSPSDATKTDQNTHGTRNAIRPAACTRTGGRTRSSLVLHAAQCGEAGM